MTAKRLLDVALGIPLLLAAGPLILAAMLLVWLEDGGAPLYFAPRVGRGGREFRMVKLRTMCPGADRMGGSSTARDDPRITQFGRLMRETKIDELPQLWNVLVGDMSSRRTPTQRPRRRSGWLRRDGASPTRRRAGYDRPRLDRVR